ncbi:MAG TPA: M48 family metallopeptidase [Acidobacteriaceae bacterium]|nr:M48 family metallopeptidase [Acidobacteriaceae bacterium]
MATTAPPLVCPQGHGPGIPGARFCNTCGSPLATAMYGQGTPALGPFAGDLTPPAGFVVPTQVATPMANVPLVCAGCGGLGVRLKADEDMCTQCGWLRPLYPGYQLDRAVFLWAGDGHAMSALQKMPPLNAVVRSVSDKVGRPWIESTFNGIRLGPRQMPDVWKQAILAARLLGLPSMPDVYLSGDHMWDAYTFGSDTSSFIVIGTSLVNNFKGDELLFVLAREMGHCRAGHALWKSVVRFLSGEQQRSGLLSGGLLGAMSPSKLISGAIDMPLMAWSRQSDITADRAGLLAVGDEALARRVLLAWSIRSNAILKRINIDEWMKQEDTSNDNVTRLSEMTTSSSMYTTRRLRLLGESAREPALMSWAQGIQPARKKLTPAPEPAPVAHRGPPPPPTVARDGLRIVCTQCRTSMTIPFAVLRGKPSLNVRCPQCHNVSTLRPKPALPSPAATAAGK